jgi:hypothetical protein
MKDGHLTCPTCHNFLVKKGDPGWEEGFGSRIGAEEYWVSYYYRGTNPEPLVQIQPIQKPDVEGEPK